LFFFYEKNEKICIFKYFIIIRVFAGAEPEDPSPLEAGLGVQLLLPDIIWGRGQVHGSGGGDGDA